MLRRCHTTRPQPHVMVETLARAFIIAFQSPDQSRHAHVLPRVKKRKKAGELQKVLSCKTSDFRKLLGGYMHNKSRVKGHDRDKV
jgi:hypothetical protein